MQTMTKSKKQTPAKVNPAQEMIRVCRRRFKASGGTYIGLSLGLYPQARDAAALARAVRDKVVNVDSNLAPAPGLCAMLEEITRTASHLEALAEKVAGILERVETECGDMVLAAEKADREDKTEWKPGIIPPRPGYVPPKEGN